MYSVDKFNQNFKYLDDWDFQVEFRLNNQLSSFDIDTLDQVFMGEYMSLKKAIEQKNRLQCFIDVGEEVRGDFLALGSVSLTWKPEENECYIGTLWIEPDFRGNGLATYIFNEIINFADELGIILTLHAMPFIDPEKKPTTEDISELKDYYRRFGFRRSSDTKGIGYDSLMERLPRISLNCQNN